MGHFQLVVLPRYLEGPEKSNNPFVIETVKIPGTHYKMSNTDHHAANVRSMPKRPKSGSTYDIFTDKQ
jgi:hypothetical protein